MSERIRIVQQGDVAEVILARPDKHNGMDMPMLLAVIAAQKQLRRTQGLRAVIIHGDGPSFCAGLDFKSVVSKPLSAARFASQLWWPMRNQFQQWSMGWRDLGVPVIAAIHGNCFGAGLQLALGADLRICTPVAKLSVLEIKWGLVPDMGGAALLRELMPIDRAKWLTMTGRVVDGAEALQLQLITELADDPLARARALAAEIQTRSPSAIAAGKFLLQQAWERSAEGALSAERAWQRRLIGRNEQQLAVKAAMGKAK